MFFINRLTLISAVIGASVIFTPLVHAIERSDILWHITQQCVDIKASGYCSNCLIPQSGAACQSAPLSCEKSLEVWAQNDAFFVMRDIKMCGCPSSFVHGLAIPKSKVTGVEDVNRPNDIWSFAWQAALARIPRDEVALVVNPRLHRSQNQLHVHIVRLNPATAESLSQRVVAHTNSIERVWALALQAAKEKNWDDYGVLVKSDGAMGFQIVISQESPEYVFTHAKCS